MRRKREMVEIAFLCDQCGKPQPKDEEKSNANWSVYPAGAKCECGGTFRMVVGEQKKETKND